ncbi:PilZ domain-containing protein [Sphingomonas sp. PL-96]|uniref:PilZ domain-containing protein n=1 Tax=Sphingomonas sp. PL-96 TaxID=2887201 RepID=UPI001E2DC36E|nr:PilZ domain-containing protein [Sphingomonas sp. PL-96]MCC2976446.1 PilZ domain-containing protein [Sphingomonas sp. PL-96]
MDEKFRQTTAGTVEPSHVRDEVQFEARGFGPAAEALQLRVLNLSSHGLSATTDLEVATGDRLRVILPVVGVMAAEVRWAKGTRFGCMFDMPIDRASYYELLAAVLEPLPPFDPQPERSSPTAASRSNK